MGTEKKYCSICAWRENCQKRFSIVTDASGCVRCPDYSRDISIKERDIDAAERASRESQPGVISLPKAQRNRLSGDRRGRTVGGSG